MTRFFVPRPNVYQCSDGYVVEIVGRTGMRYSEGGRTMFVDSEILAPPAGVAIYKDTIARWEPPHAAEALSPDECLRIRDNIVAALQSQGIAVDLL
jgi:hypothetical protein